MQFKKLIGNEAIKKQLINLYRLGKIPHALLFIAQEGTGGLAMAIALAQYIFCKNKQADDSCGQCPSCKKINNLTFPDLHLSFPTIGAKTNLSEHFYTEFREFVQQSPYAGGFEWLQFINAENKQGNISADECRAIINRLNLTTFGGGYKIQIIWLAEYLGKEGNILLKLLEEPPEKTLLFLVTEAEGQILNTILSRTQKIRLAPLEVNTLAKALVSRYGQSENKALKIAKMADNSLAKALSILHNEGDNDLLKDLIDWFNALFTFNPLLTSQWVDKMAKIGREQQKQFLAYAQTILANVLRLKLMPGYQAPLTSEEKAFTDKLKQVNLSPLDFEAMQQYIEQASYHISRNSHGKTELLALSIKLQYLIKGQSIKAL